jgi:hypothetical protein
MTETTKEGSGGLLNQEDQVTLPVGSSMTDGKYRHLLV